MADVPAAFSLLWPCSASYGVYIVEPVIHDTDQIENQSSHPAQEGSTLHFAGRKD